MHHLKSRSPLDTGHYPPKKQKRDELSISRLAMATASNDGMLHLLTAAATQVRPEATGTKHLLTTAATQVRPEATGTKCPFCQLIFSSISCSDFSIMRGLKGPSPNKKKTLRRDARRHCREKHPNLIMWNIALLPVPTKTIPYMILAALRNVERALPLTEDIVTVEDCLKLFKKRLNATKLWIIWCLPKIKDQDDEDDDKVQAKVEAFLDSLLKQLKRYTRTKRFKERCSSTLPSLWVNELQLFFRDTSKWRNSFYLHPSYSIPALARVNMQTAIHSPSGKGSDIEASGDCKSSSARVREELQLDKDKVSLRKVLNDLYVYVERPKDPLKLDLKTEVCLLFSTGWHIGSVLESNDMSRHQKMNARRMKSPYLIKYEDKSKWLHDLHDPDMYLSEANFSRLAKSSDSESEISVKDGMWCVVRLPSDVKN